jgi:DNA-binding HxlR family transcriptional regulator
MIDQKDIDARSGCPIATTLDIVGDRWSLLILRDMFVGKSRYGEFLTSPEHVPTNILAERLKRLERYGLISKAAYQTNPPRYEYRLTADGETLLPVLQSICRWANARIPGTWTPPRSFMEREVSV